MGPNNALGPDGFNAFFYQNHWDTVGPLVTEAIQSFFSTCRLLKDWNHTFLCLVPKIANAEHLSDSCLYHAVMLSSTLLQRSYAVGSKS